LANSGKRVTCQRGKIWAKKRAAFLQTLSLQQIMVAWTRIELVTRGFSKRGSSQVPKSGFPKVFLGQSEFQAYCWRTIFVEVRVSGAFPVCAGYKYKVMRHQHPLFTPKIVCIFVVDCFAKCNHHSKLALHVCTSARLHVCT
jgi:hypothetical protein